MIKVLRNLTGQYSRVINVNIMRAAEFISTQMEIWTSVHPVCGCMCVCVCVCVYGFTLRWFLLSFCSLVSVRHVVCTHPCIPSHVHVAIMTSTQHFEMF